MVDRSSRKNGFDLRTNTKTRPPNVAKVPMMKHNVFHPVILEKSSPRTKLHNTGTDKPENIDTECAKPTIAAGYLVDRS